MIRLLPARSHFCRTKISIVRWSSSSSSASIAYKAARAATADVIFSKKAPKFLTPALEALSEFPEIKTYSSTPSVNLLPSLLRPIEIFDSIYNPSPLTSTSTSKTDIGIGIDPNLSYLLGAYHVNSTANASHGLWSSASTSLTKSLSLQTPSLLSQSPEGLSTYSSNSRIQLSTYSLWQGDFKSALEHASVAVDSGYVSNDIESLCYALHAHSLASFFSHTQLSSLPPTDTNTNMEASEDTIELLQKSTRHADSLVSSIGATAFMNNMGIVQYLLTGDSNESISIWEEGLDSLSNVEDSVSLSVAKAALHANIAAVLLCHVDPESKLGGPSVADVTDASDSASIALKLLESIPSHERGFKHTLSRHGYDSELGRVLTLLATCYGYTGSAVTAEGLYSSALEKACTSSGKDGSAGFVTPISRIREVHTMREMSALYTNWEKREGEAKQIDLKAEDVILEMDSGGSKGWENWMQGGKGENKKLGVLAGLCLFDRGDFV